MNAHTAINTAPESVSSMWRNYVAAVRGDAVEAGHPDVLEYAADNGLTPDEALADYRHDFCFLCPVIGLWFNFEDGVEINGEWQHADAHLVGAA